ncbi:MULTISPECIES: LysR family transcriptional regulator [Achromobacter]|uniref:HTH-type transcriptional regulator TsaR n=1 Tax=Achromobacter piechaudii TaxID=72556 RepID=A0A6S7E6B2_9BURK|nr:MULTISPECIES: LysR family transcriptional regulator [Achromobacter]KNY06606.1 LysR family transcriptional regulator [Achromobacter piechaudii]MPS81348.1 LysR family transcriptional regulator [Achromobacter sp.]CAB3739623.1 HTH-type transcriptional regulator TsaR [Achromobacter piechaudii]CAB3895828.1 HTH-type transcriptional regulator TsaR [Achromobacter piechaudii]CAB3918787.1 HTH-type transcriptional regulator TsaR [Achromobacter piechaudii]
MPFDLHQLAAFNAVVAAGSLGRAADAMHLTQSALSRIVRRLEGQVGAPLFERHSKGMQLTDIGLTLLPHSIALLRDAESAKEEIRAMLGLAKGTIRVGTVGSIACLILPTALTRTCNRWPTLQVQVVEGVWDRLASALLSREIDLALGAHTEDTDEIVSVPDCRWEDTSYVVASTDHPLRSRPALSLADTLEHKWAILPRGTDPFEHMNQLFNRHCLPMPDVTVETRSITVLKNLIAHSDFLGWMPEPMYHAELRAGLLDRLPIPGASDTRMLTAFRRTQGLLPLPAAKLLSELRQLATNPPRHAPHAQGPRP